MAKRKPQLDQHELIEELPVACASELAAVEFLERKRWGDSPCCAECGSVDVYKMMDKQSGERGRRFLWRCRDCSKQYTVRTGTIYAESLIPLHKWCRALWECGSAKNGVSALEMSRKLQVSYKSALFLMHRIRHAMAQDPRNPPKLTGTVEVDETYCGGKPRYRGTAERPLNKRGRGTAKQPVFAMVERGGKVRSRVIATVNAQNVKQIMRENIDQSAKIMTDNASFYNGAAPEFAGHEVVNHGAGEYVRGNAHTNTIEGFFSRVKRGLNGTYHAVSKKHLHRYMSHFEYMYNTRGLNDGERTLELLEQARGKRLMYKEPIAKKLA